MIIGTTALTNRDKTFIAFCDELRAYIEEHHLFPDKLPDYRTRSNTLVRRSTRGRLKSGDG